MERDIVVREGVYVKVAGGAAQLVACVCVCSCVCVQKDTSPVNIWSFLPVSAPPPPLVAPAGVGGLRSFLLNI